LNEPARAYHHGDLRAALVDAGLAALQDAAIEDLSLRQLAREVGVSATAVYRHFPDKRALLSALADHGVELLAQAQQAAAQAAPPEDRFAATGRAYVRFALANPALFRLIFAYTCASGETVFGNSLAARMLQGHAAERGQSPDDTRRLIVQAWAVVHGLAMLMLDGQLPADDALIDTAINSRTLFGG
jgi:AcrR family transcriptional regulator